VVQHRVAGGGEPVDDVAAEVVDEVADGIEPADFSGACPAFSSRVPDAVLAADASW
jgi:hypothetical protein